jgi:hypothetical protein
MYGLIRQESRFLVAARSSVGASGLMQVMPATASWTARKLGIPYSPELLTDRATNLRIGAGYLKLVLDDFEGTQAMAAAAYNAGPGRPRRWREGARSRPPPGPRTCPLPKPATTSRRCWPTPRCTAMCCMANPCPSKPVWVAALVPARAPLHPTTLTCRKG